MRINVYSEEITDKVEVAIKEAKTGASFYGLLFFLHSPKQLHHSNTDNDQSAVILWKDSPEALLALLVKATDAVQQFIESEAK
jgi:hypothetical protein